MTGPVDGPDGYDRIGAGYARHRRADPRIARQVSGALGDAGRVVNVGAGTGSYEPVDRAVVAVEPSAVMVAQRPAAAAPAVRAVAEDLPFADGSFDAAMAVITVHHWTDLDAGLAELCRVAPRVVVLTFDPAIHFGYWLFDYLPEARQLPSAAGPPVDDLARRLGARSEVVAVPADCVDGFNWAYWRRPEAYLDAEVRACISGLAQLPTPVVEAAVARLAADLADGAWDARYGQLRRLEQIDGGFRLLVRG